ncbi:phage tail spike protein, partial [Dellaglioa algida]|uniref:phage tail spike protein n=1 Tax=Dellaglioa algida TaxID=105612 RepID=UPI00164806FF
MTILYKEGTTDYSNIGLGSLNGLLNGTVTQARNGQYDMTFSYPRNGLLASELKPGAIVVSDSGHDALNQQFDIQTVTRKTGNSLEVYATHVSYRQILTSLKPSVKVTGSAQVALNAWKDGHVEKFNGAVVSDISTSQTIDWTVGNVTNAREALGGVTGSLLDVFGGEFVFDNENVQLASGAGRNTGVTIAYGKNLTSLEQQESIESTWTSIYPYAKKMNTSSDETGASEEVTITLPEYYLDSENTSKFSKRRIQMVDFSSDDTVKDVTSLRTRASAYMKSNNFGIPKVSIKTSFLDLSKTVEMSQYPQFERVSLCDTVRVYFEEMGIDTKAKVIETVWNMITDTYDSLTLGESVSNMTTQFDQQDKNNNEILDALNTVQDAANGFNKIFRGPDTPVAKNIGDLWYEPDGEFWNEYMWNGSIWELIASTRKTSEISDAVDEAQKDAEAAKNQANESVAAANDAAAKAGFAKDTATQAKSDAAAAGQQAKDALTSAG